MLLHMGIQQRFLARMNGILTHSGKETGEFTFALRGQSCRWQDKALELVRR